MIDLAPIHNSQINCARRCLRQYRYAYVERLEPKKVSLPLARGQWLHYGLAAEHIARGIDKQTLLQVPVLEIDDVGMVHVDALQAQFVVPKTEEQAERRYELSWQGMIDLLTHEVWMRLFPEEQEDYHENGYYLPDAARKILRSYFYWWKNTLAEEEPLLIEQPWQRQHDSGHTFEGRIDLLLRDRKGNLVLRDWKSTKSAPKSSWKLMESQLHIYPWGINSILKQHGLEQVSYIEFDYLLTKPPTKPKQNQDGSLSKAKIDTDALTYLEALREYGIEITPEHKKKLKELKEDNPFFQRHPSPRSKKVTNQILDEALQTATLMRQIHERPTAGAVRTVRQSCDWDCAYQDLCMGELWGNDVSTIRKREFRVNPEPKALPEDV